MGEPIIIALEHRSLSRLFETQTRDRLKAARKEVSKFLGLLARNGAKRTLYIEGSKGTIDGILAKGIRGILQNLSRKSTQDYLPPEPFEVAILAAKKHGWEIKPLDSKEITGKLTKGGCNDIESRYVGYDIRERKWAIKTRRAGENDIIVMHPNHVSGFLKMSGINLKKVAWISKPRRESDLRLTQRQVRRLREDRKRQVRLGYLWKKGKKWTKEKIGVALRKITRPK